ncbi:MAG: YqgE/AlgH family protein [Actinomycetota bacterium]
MGNLVGRLLVATSLIADPNFRKAVVLLVEHGDDGALGLVLTRPATMPVEEAAPLLAGLVEPGAPLHLGGPLSPQSALVLVEATEAAEAGLTSTVIPGDGACGPVGILPVDTTGETAAAGGGVVRARVYAGYAGWGPGQLEGELATSAWLVEPASAADVFTGEPADLWASTLRRKGGNFKVLALMPWDPADN